MAITGLRGLLVPGPVATPSRYGLLSVAQDLSVTDPHWQAGLEFEDTLCVPAGSTLPHCGSSSPSPNPKDPEAGPDFRMADPFTLYGSYECSVGGRPVNSAFEIARARLLAREEIAAEKVLWTGVTAAGTVGPSFADGDGVDLSPVDLTPGSGAVDPVTGMGLLEAALADCAPGLGVVHVPPALAATLRFHNLLELDGSTYRTPMGNPAVLGGGYPGGTGPGGDTADDGEAWLFATGPIGFWRSEVFMTPDLPKEAIDRSFNNITVFAERTWALGISCCLLAVRVLTAGGVLS